MIPSNDPTLSLTVQNKTQQGALFIQDAFTQTDHRHGLIDADFLNIWSDILAQETRDGSNAIWYETGKTWGESYYRYISESEPSQPSNHSVNPQDFLKDDVIENLNANFSYLGFGQFRLTEGNKFYTIELKNPFIKTPQLSAGENIIVLLSGFFAVLFSRFSEKPLECIPFNPADEQALIRFAISTEAVIGELLPLVMNKKSFREIAELYHNQHLL